jgi:hypothetical protein
MRTAVLVALVVAGLGVAFLARHSIWRAAYPHLPRQVQAAPYLLIGLADRGATPQPLPTPASGPRIAERPTAFVETEEPANAAPAAPAGRDTPAEATTAAAPAPTVVLPPIPVEARLPEITHQYQTWNNCGPATLGMAMGLIGDPISQADVAREVKPDPNDKNVSPQELAGFAVRRGVRALIRSNGTVDEVKRLIAAGVPVIGEVWFIPEPSDEMGHYVLITGYSDVSGVLEVRDSYRGPNVRLSYAEFDADWRVFNRTYIALYPAALDEVVAAILGPRLDDRTMFGEAAERALGEIESHGDAFAWFNLGTNLTALGDYEGASSAFDQARAIGLPWRMLWYQFGPFEAYAELERWADVVSLTNANLANAPNLEESHYWLAMALEAQGDHAGAQHHLERVKHFNPLFEPPRNR